jgi:tetratricopeptide (TPR) repeat protein
MNKCSLCKKVVPEGSPVEWTHSTGTRINVPTTLNPSVVVSSSVGEITICEHCYNDLPKWLSREDQYNIHYEFGLEYRDIGQHQQSIVSLRHALTIHSTPDALAALAYAHEQLGNTQEAINLYEQVVLLDTGHQMAANNLRLLKSKTR